MADRYDVTSNFASCPAATGESRCTHFPDGAHRCSGDRTHMQADTRPTSERTHRCTCGVEWTSLVGTVGTLFERVIKPTDSLLIKLISEYAGETAHSADSVSICYCDGAGRHVHGDNCPPLAVVSARCTSSSETASVCRNVDHEHFPGDPVLPACAAPKSLYVPGTDHP